MNPFKLTIYDKAFSPKCDIGDPLSLVMTARHNVQPTGSLMLPTNHGKIDKLLADGARYDLWYNGEQLSSGVVQMMSARGPLAKSVMTFQLQDDYRLLKQETGWPVPGSALTSQTVVEKTYTGDAETIVKDVVTDNLINRLSRPVTCATNLNRGSTVPSGVKARFQALESILFPAVEQAGVGVTMRQSGSGIICDVYEPTAYAHTLTEESGVVQDWEFSQSKATATRVIVGGSGEGTARIFRPVVDSALETALGDVIEVFVDARDESNTTALDDRGQQFLDENASKSGFALTLAETDTFRYGGTNGVHVGDIVTVDVGFGTRTDVLREVTLSFARDGLRVTPVMGEIRDNPDRTIAQNLKRMWRAIESLRVK